VPTQPDGHWSFAGTELPGIYRLQEESPGTEARYAINVDVSESDLHRVDRPGWLRLARNSPVRAGGKANGLVREFPLARWFLGAALALLIVESVCGNHSTGVGGTEDQI
jgi:hypothetical protein